MLLVWTESSPACTRHCNGALVDRPSLPLLPLISLLQIPAYAAYVLAVQVLIPYWKQVGGVDSCRVVVGGGGDGR